ncbi:hypothetical protein J2X69_003161 [Algoriphagus sp. 4150]|nr:hypothetical protein [Algoriphagus sp. 4150]
MYNCNDASSRIFHALLAGRPILRLRSARVTEDRSRLPLVFSEYYDTFLPLLVEKWIIIKQKI